MVNDMALPKIFRNLIGKMEVGFQCVRCDFYTRRVSDAVQHTVENLEMPEDKDKQGAPMPGRFAQATHQMEVVFRRV